MYRAPELSDLHSGQPVGPQVDVWALGCVLHVLLVGTHPFQDAILQSGRALKAGSNPCASGASPGAASDTHRLIRARSGVLCGAEWSLPASLSQQDQPLVAMLCDMLQRLPSERPTASQASRRLGVLSVN